MKALRRVLSARVRPREYDPPRLAAEAPEPPSGEWLDSAGVCGARDQDAPVGIGGCAFPAGHAGRHVWYSPTGKEWTWPNSR